MRVHVVYACMCVYVCLYAGVYECICVFMCLFVFVYLCICVSVSLCVCVCLSVCVCLLNCVIAHGRLFECALAFRVFVRIESVYQN